MSAHTPGPWHRNIPPATKYPTVFAGRNKHIAVVQTLGMSPEEVEANINLISAAPGMYEALCGLDLTCHADPLNPCWAGRPTDVAGTHWGGGSACPACVARAALAKAVAP